MVLDNLKDVWKNQKENTIQFSESDIYKMIHKKSTSIVKWIFYISIIEFVILLIPNFFNNSSEAEDQLNAKAILTVITYISYVVTLFFIFVFYRNYRRISVTDSAKKLMATILKTRNAVKHYVIAILTLGAITLSVIYYKISISEELLANLPEDFNITILGFLFFIIAVFILGLMLLFYKLIYGILLNRLRDNYKELQRNE